MRDLTSGPARLHENGSADKKASGGVGNRECPVTGSGKN